MKTIILNLSHPARPSFRRWTYGIAGYCLSVDRSADALAPFALAAPPDDRVRRPAPVLRCLRSEDNLVYDAPAWVGNAMRRVRCWFDGSLHEISIDAIGLFCVSADGREIMLLERYGAPSDPILIEAAIGPALMLALAIDGIFCLHASAVTLGDGVVLFLGDSGAGKSTLARRLPDAASGILRMTDDISPFQLAAGGFRLLPDFPQLKLGASQQQVGPGQGSTAIRAIYQLHRKVDAACRDSPISARRLGGLGAFTALVAQTVAKSLFPRQLLGRHMQQIGGLTSAVPLYRLTYPSGEEHIGALRAFLIECAAMS